MTTITLDEVLAQARALSFEEQRRLIEALSATALPPQPLKSLTQLMAEQQTRPLAFAELVPSADSAPEESAEEMVTSIYAQRHRDTHRSLSQ